MTLYNSLIPYFNTTLQIKLKIKFSKQSNSACLFTWQLHSRLRTIKAEKEVTSRVVVSWYGKGVFCAFFQLRFQNDVLLT